MDGWAQLKAKAPPRRWTTNQPQFAMLRDLLTDCEGIPMVPTYGSKQARRHAYYETRKDLARRGASSPIRVQRGVLASPALTMNQIAASAGRCRTQLTRLLRLSWLSPQIVDAIAGGTQPRSLTRKVLTASPLPIDWAEQERMLGIPA